MVSKDYLLDHSNLDWTSLLRDWMWLIPPDFTVLKMSRFGDLFIVLRDGAVHMLDISAGTLTKIAQSQAEFAQKLQEADNATNWFLIPLVDLLRARGLVLLDGQCYGLRQPTALGGSYKFENICVIGIADYLGGYGSVHAQLKDLPDGTQITTKPR